MQDKLVWLEALFYVSGIIIAIFAGYSAQQIRLIKRDIFLRNQRAASEKAIEYCDRFLTSRLHDQFTVACMDNNIPYRYDGQISDFSQSSIPDSYRDTWLKRVALYNNWLPVVNEMDVIASSLISGVADECLAFSIIGRSFCNAIESNYDVICMMRSDSILPHHQSIVNLYKLWRPRLTKEELQLDMAMLEDKIKNIPEKHIQPIGADKKC